MKSHLVFWLLLPLLFFSVDAFERPGGANWDRLKSCATKRPKEAAEQCYDFVYARVKTRLEAEGVCARLHALELLEAVFSTDEKKNPTKVYCRYMASVTCADEDYVIFDRCYKIVEKGTAMTIANAVTKCGSEENFPTIYSQYHMKHVFAYALKHTTADFVFINGKETIPGILRFHRNYQVSIPKDSPVVIRLTIDKAFNISQRGRAHVIDATRRDQFTAAAICVTNGNPTKLDALHLQRRCEQWKETKIATWYSNGHCYYRSRNLYKATRDTIGNLQRACAGFGKNYKARAAVLVPDAFSQLNDMPAESLRVGVHRLEDLAGQCGAREADRLFSYEARLWKSYDTQAKKALNHAPRIDFKNREPNHVCTDFPKGSTTASVKFNAKDRSYLLEATAAIDARPVLCEFFVDQCANSNCLVKKGEASFLWSDGNECKCLCDPPNRQPKPAGKPNEFHCKRTNLCGTEFSTCNKKTATCEDHNGYYNCKCKNPKESINFCTSWCKRPEYTGYCGTADTQCLDRETKGPNGKMVECGCKVEQHVYNPKTKTCYWPFAMKQCGTVWNTKGSESTLDMGDNYKQKQRDGPTGGRYICKNCVVFDITDWGGEWNDLINKVVIRKGCKATFKRHSEKHDGASIEYIPSSIGYKTWYPETGDGGSLSQIDCECD